jgi:DNA modification methylase
VNELVEVFREVKRVLRDDGTLWLNLGDSYAGKAGGNQGKHGQRYDRAFTAERIMDKLGDGLKPKDLIGIPWMVAFALRADGWFLRQDIIWNKPNPMPESVKDRCTKSHEYIFLLTKSPNYYFDAEAIKEPAKYFNGVDDGEEVIKKDKRAGAGRIDYGGKRNGVAGTGQKSFVHIEELRNKRSVWNVATHSYKGAHFATFPTELIEPCIKAGCPRGGVVLDPFGGAGTTGIVSDRLQRDAVLIELNPEYAAIAENRLFHDSPLFSEVSQ